MRELRYRLVFVHIGDLNGITFHVLIFLSLYSYYIPLLLLHRLVILAVEFNKGLEEVKEKKWPMKLILISIASGAVVSAFINGGLHLMARRKRRGNNSHA